MGRRFVAALLVGVIFGCTNPDETLQPVTFESAGVDGQLAALGRSLGDSRIVLTSVFENGHHAHDPRACGRVRCALLH
jgi:hypothetical protein